MFNRAMLVTLWRFLLVVIVTFGLIWLTSGCVGLPTVEPAPTAAPAAQASFTPTPALQLVTILGDVYVRDNNYEVKGWLPLGGAVRASCVDEWCYLDSGYKFWRGCSSDNPGGLPCK